MVNINWTNEAEVWLEDIFNFISGDSKKIAKKVVKEIFEKVQILQMFPKLGYKYYEEDERLYIDKAKLYIKMKNYNQALEEIEKGYKINPKSKEVEKEKEKILKKLGK